MKAKKKSKLLCEEDEIKEQLSFVRVNQSLTMLFLVTVIGIIVDRKKMFDLFRIFFLEVRPFFTTTRLRYLKSKKKSVL